LERDGFEKVGVNLIARTAGVDKDLIYRYIGGLDGPLTSFGESADVWWTIEEIVGEERAGPERGNLSAWCALALIRQEEALRRSPVTQQILLWELSQSNGLTRHLNELSEMCLQQLVRRVMEAWRARRRYPSPGGARPARRRFRVSRLAGPEHRQSAWY